MDGEISVKSKKGRGSNFILAFPANISEEISPFAGVQEEVDKQYQFEGKTFLLLDDVPDNCFLMKEVLSRHGINSIIASNGVDALEIYKENPKKIDMIITDLRMPVMSGQTFIIEIRKYETETKLAKVPVIIVTAENSIEERKLCLAKYGADEYLIKPIKYNDIIHTIEKLYSGKPREKVKSVLILDDEAIAAKFLSVLLVQNGYKCQVRNSVTEAKQYFKECGSECDIVLLDNLLGDGTGSDFIIFIDNLLKEKDIKFRPTIISISGNTIADQQEAYSGSNVNGYLQKPIKKQDLLDLIAIL